MKFNRLPLVSTIILLISVSAYSNIVGIEFARQLAINFSKQQGISKIERINLEYIENTDQNQPAYYIFNINENSFIIISAEDALMPVLGYSKSGKFIINKDADNFRSFISEYKQQVKFARQNQLEASDETRSLWQLYTYSEFPITNRTSKLDPLLKTSWNQAPYYNELCPGGSVTGCGATAMAQIMKYWSYPAQGLGYHSYNHPAYGTLSANFGNTHYNWNNMPDYINTPNQSIALLMYHCGVAQNMDYSTMISWSYMNAIESGFENFFAYKSSSALVSREGYSENAWVNLMLGELNNSRPILYRGAGAGGGHFFIFDGYDNNNFFHINWGWGGSYDGYFNINALNPGGVGIGGGTGGYNEGHFAIIGIEPEEINNTNSFQLNLYTSISANPVNPDNNAPFTISVNIANLGNNDFTGDFTAALFSADGVFIDYVEIVSNKKLDHGFYYNLSFKTTGISTIRGTHKIGIYYRLPGEQWVLVNPSTYSNPINIQISSPPNDISLYSKMNLNKNPLTQNEALSITTDIVNWGTSDFNGWLRASLFDNEKKFIQDIEIISNVNIPAGFYLPNVTLSNAGLDVPPGTYYIALYNSVDYQNWPIISNAAFENPVILLITQLTLQSDIYETNETKETAYNLAANFIGDEATVTTTGSNLHTRSDYDYYALNLPKGYDYAIDARVGDRFYTIDNNTYDADVQFSHNAYNEFLDLFDTRLFDLIKIKDGGKLTFFVAPYNVGITGSYILDLKITRSAITSTQNNKYQSSLNLFPNPARDELKVRYSENFIPVSGRIINSIGTEIKNIALKNSHASIFHINISDLINGVYFIELMDEYHNKLCRKFSITR